MCIIGVLINTRAMLYNSGLPEFLRVEVGRRMIYIPTAEHRRKHSKDGRRTSI